jgi:integrase
VREVDLSDAAVAALERQKAFTLLKRPDGPIFENPETGKPWNDLQVQRRRYFVPTLTALKIRHRDMYQTRHTFATLLLMGGVNPTYISRQLGHANTGMLFKVYGTWIEGADRGAEAEKANALLGQLSTNCPREEGQQ